MSATDPQYQAHYQTWIGFTKFVKYSLIAIIIVLGALAVFVV